MFCSWYLVNACIFLTLPVRFWHHLSAMAKILHQWNHQKEKHIHSRVSSNVKHSIAWSISQIDQSKWNTKQLKCETVKRLNMKLINYRWNMIQLKCWKWNAELTHIGMHSQKWIIRKCFLPNLWPFMGQLPPYGLLVSSESMLLPLLWRFTLDIVYKNHLWLESQPNVINLTQTLKILDACFTIYEPSMNHLFPVLSSKFTLQRFYWMCCYHSEGNNIISSK